MKRLSLLAVVLGVAFGCHGAEEDTRVPPSQMLNPSGQPRTDQESSQAIQEQQGGEAASARMAEAAKAMKEAQEKSSKH